MFWFSSKSPYSAGERHERDSVLLSVLFISFVYVAADRAPNPANPSLLDTDV